MAAYLSGKVIFVSGSGDPNQRAVATALAEAGADIVVAGPSAPEAEVLLHSIANEIWAIGRRALVVGFEAADPVSFAQAVERATSALGRVDLVVRCEAVLSA
jgi:NAD(P)-dependent dehydrogenase (short-subunit alcohol dehydrogenase family)